MKENTIEKKLEEAGMSEAEARVYMALLSRPSMSAQEITKASNLPRSTVVVALEKLARLKVIDEYFFGKRRNFVVRTVAAIENYAIEQARLAAAQKAELGKLISDLQGLHFLTNIPGIQIERLKGEEGFKELYNRTLNLKRGEKIMILGVEAEKFMFYPEFLEAYTKEKNKKGIETLLLFPESKLGRDVLAREKKAADLRTTKLLPRALYNPDAQIMIWGDYVSIMTWGENLETLVINSKPIVDILASVFHLLWNNNKK